MCLHTIWWLGVSIPACTTCCDVSSMAIAEGAAALLQLLNDSRMDDDVAELPKTNLDIALVADFANYVPKVTHELELKFLMDAVDSLRDRPLQVARIRLAWQGAIRAQDKTSEPVPLIPWRSVMHLSQTHTRFTLHSEWGLPPQPRRDWCSSPTSRCVSQACLQRDAA